MEESSAKRERVHSPFDNVAEIPEDIIIYILMRLPVISLLRFKLVSKTWYNLIKTPYFKSMHHNFGSTTSKLLTCPRRRFKKDPVNEVFSFRSNDKSARVLLPDLKIPSDRNYGVHIAGCCNGIVCYYYGSSTIFLSNPATREFKQLPPTSIQSEMQEALKQIGVAFGFDSPNIYDFKVLRVFGVVNSKKKRVKSKVKTLRAEMFTLSSNNWRQLDFGLDIFGLNDYLGFCINPSFFCANSFNFMTVYRKPKPIEEWARRTIVCCDIKAERIKMMDLPSFPYKDDPGNGNFYSLMMFKEFLSAGFKCDPQKWTHIWIMKDYGVVESWTKLYRITGVEFSLPLCFWMDDHALLMLDHDKKKIVSCNMNTLNIDSIQIYENNMYPQVDPFLVVIYIETLVSIM